MFFEKLKEIEKMEHAKCIKLHYFVKMPYCQQRYLYPLTLR